MMKASGMLMMMVCMSRRASYLDLVGGGRRPWLWFAVAVVMLLASLACYAVGGSVSRQC